MKNDDDTYTVYGADSQVYFTSDKIMTGSLNDDVFISKKLVDGQSYYGIIELK